MIIIWLIVLIAIIICIGIIISKYFYYNENILILCVVCSIALITVTLVISVRTIAENISAEGKYNANKQRYEAILYKLNTESVRDEFGLLNKEYVDEIQEWNIDYSKYKAYSENIWIGIMFPKREIEGMDVIDLNNFK